MKKYLLVKYEPRTNSELDQLTNAFLDSVDPNDVEIIELGSENLDFFDKEKFDLYMKRNVMGKDLTVAESHQMRKIDYLCNKIKSAQKVVLAYQIINFSVPAPIKTWMDMVGIGNVAFDVTHRSSHRGLFGDKEALILNTSAAAKFQSTLDLSTPLIKINFNFWGIKKIKFIGAYGLRVSDVNVEEVAEEVKKFVADW